MGSINGGLVPLPKLTSGAAQKYDVLSNASIIVRLGTNATPLSFDSNKFVDAGPVRVPFVGDIFLDGLILSVLPPVSLSITASLDPRQRTLLVG